MNYINRFMLIVGLISISQLAYSSSITDTYTAGDTLTATTLDNIKSAVNDNDSRLTNGIISIPAQAFHSDDDPSNCNWRASLGLEYGALIPAAASCDVVAAVQLPDGVDIETFTCYLMDNSASHHMIGRLLRTAMASGTPSAVITLSSTIDDGSNIQSISSSIPFAVGNEIVDNAAYAYYIAIDFVGDTSTVNLDNRVYGCKIEY